MHANLAQHSSKNLYAASRVINHIFRIYLVFFPNAHDENAAVMVYWVEKPNREAWYASFKKKDGWSLFKAKGISEQEIAKLITVPNDQTA